MRRGCEVIGEDKGEGGVVRGFVYMFLYMFLYVMLRIVRYHVTVLEEWR